VEKKVVTLSREAAKGLVVGSEIPRFGVQKLDTYSLQYLERAT